METNKKKLITDFGEKMDGAKKDNYIAKGGVTFDDINSMNERELTNIVKKDTVWPKPDYKKMLEEGFEPECLYFIKEVRDALPAKPISYQEKYVKIYLDLINVYRTACEEFKEAKSLPSAKHILSRIAYEFDFEYLRAREHRKAYKVITMTDSELSSLRVEAAIQNFPHEFNGTLKGLTVKKYNGGNYIIVKNNKRLYGFNYQHETLESALKTIKEDIIPSLLNKKAEKKKKSLKQQYVRPQLEGIERIGPDYRKGKDATGDDLLTTFGFRGGQFGNWNTQGDRQACLNHAYDAFHDLMRILKCALDFASLGGYQGKKLGIAFGSRGVSGALAHYEHIHVLINLTKLKGAGSLAHEWGHALDDFIGIKCGYKGLFSRNRSPLFRDSDELLFPDVQKSFIHLMDVIKYKPCTDEEVIEKKNRELEYLKERVVYYTSNLENARIRVKGSDDRYTTDEEREAILKAKNKLFETMTSESYNELINLHKKITNKFPSKDRRDFLELSLRRYSVALESLERFKEGRLNKRPSKDTSFYSNSKQLDKLTGKAYLQTNVELFARAFECYIEDKLKEEGSRSDYLVHSTFNDSLDNVSPYPAGEERELINQAMEQLLEVVVKTFSTPDEHIVTDQIINTQDFKCYNIADDSDTDIQNNKIDTNNEIEEMMKKENAIEEPLKGMFDTEFEDDIIEEIEDEEVEEPLSTEEEESDIEYEIDDTELSNIDSEICVAHIQGEVVKEPLSTEEEESDIEDNTDNTELSNLNSGICVAHIQAEVVKEPLSTEEEESDIEDNTDNTELSNLNSSSDITTTDDNNTIIDSTTELEENSNKEYKYQVPVFFNHDILDFLVMKNNEYKLEQIIEDIISKQAQKDKEAEEERIRQSYLDLLLSKMEELR